MTVMQWRVLLLTWLVLIHISNGFVGRASSDSVTSYAELVDPETNCKVVLLGCLHGSTSSASDVKMLLKDQHTDVVVLELCASRFGELRSANKRKLEDPLSVVQGFTSMLARTKEKKGIPTAVAAFAMGGASLLNTALSGNTPGLEFTTAMEMAENTEGCDILLADQDVDETLRKMGSLPSISLSMMTNFAKAKDWSQSYGQDADTLRTAIFGDASMKESEQVQLGSFLVRNEAVKNDLVRLTILPLILSALTAKVVIFLLDIIFGSADASAVNSVTLYHDIGISFQEITQMVLGEVSELFRSMAVLAIGFIVVALPAARVILTDRDEYLERGIRSACQIAASKSNDGRVVAVLGLLHVNNVAKRLLDNKNK